VTLNIGSARKTAGAGSAKAARAAAQAPVAASADRPLLGAVLDELSSWNPREFITAFQRWHQGAISLIHLNVLTTLEANGPMSMSAIAEALDISVASATGVIDRMEARGLVKRRRHPDDRRVVLVQPAAGGRKVFGDIDKRRRKGLAMLLGRLSDEELNGLLIGHRALHAARQAMAAQGQTHAHADALRTRAPRAHVARGRAGAGGAQA
jgi:DNA-binding MarR family transcriptional regulator